MHPLLETSLSFLEVERNLSPRTCSAYMRDIQAFCVFLRQDSDDSTDLAVMLGAVTRAEVRRWLAQLRRRQKKVTVARKISALRGFYTYIARRLDINSNPFDAVRRPKVESRLPSVMDVDGVYHFLESISGTDWMERRNLAIFELLYSCGLRISELTDIDVPDVDFATAQV